MKSGKDLIYEPFLEPHFQEPINQYSGKLPCGILTLYRVWAPSLIENAFEIKVIFHNHYGFDDEHHIRTENPTYENSKGLLGLITIYCAKYTFKDFTQLASNFIFVSLKRYFKSGFYNINTPRLTG